MPDLNTSQQDTPNGFSNDGVIWSHGVIRQLLCNAYNVDELICLAQDLSVSADLDGHEGRTKYAREMVDMCVRRGKLGELLELVAKHRPDNYKLYKRSLTRENKENLLVYVNFVVVAMTREEAQQLRTDPDTYTRRDFKEKYDEFSSIPEYMQWFTCYRDDRDYWEPHSCPESSIIQIIEDTFMRLQPQIVKSFRNSKQTIVLQPRFYSQDFFTNMTLADNLKKSGCFLIVDTISLFHKEVWETFLQTGISEDDTVSMLMLTPINLGTNPVHNLITEMVRRNLRMGFKKFAEDWNLSFEYGNADKIFSSSLDFCYVAQIC
ncbi:MAG: hypothetical protein IPJ94_22970 [Chloroflexi bacterium]|nr:hypothetical protein [Chloroflexota bacterium]